MELVTPGWRFVHIGFEDDGIAIDGVGIWNASWAATGHQITVAHPQYPNQRHSMSTYRVDASGRAMEFAAGEFSNGVWGFFVPDRPRSTPG